MYKYIIFALLIWFSVSCTNKKKQSEKELYAEFFYDYEDIIKNGFQNRAYRELSISGKMSNILNNENRFGIAEKKFFSEIKCPEFNELNFQAWICPLNKSINGVFVLSIIDTATNESKYWEGFAIEQDIENPKSWFKIKGKLKLELTDRKPGDQIHFYFWNRDTTAFLVDDLEVNLCQDFSSGNTLFYDLEQELDYKKSHTITNETAYSGAYSSKVTGKNSYSISINKPIAIVNDFSNISKVGISCYLKSEEPVVDAVFVFTLVDSVSGESDYWQGKVVEDKNFNTDSWTKISAEFLLPDSIKNTEKFQVYMWNRKGNTLYVDDIYIAFKQEDESTSEPYIDLTKGTWEEQKKLNYPPFRTKHLKKKADYTSLLNAENINPNSVVSAFSVNFEGKANDYQTFILTKNQIFKLDKTNQKIIELNQEIDFKNLVKILVHDIDSDPEQEILLAYSNHFEIGNFNKKINQFELKKYITEEKVIDVEIYQNKPLALTDNSLYFIDFNNEIDLTKIEGYKTDTSSQYNLVSGTFLNTQNEHFLIFNSNSTEHNYLMCEIMDNMIYLKEGNTLGVDTLKANDNFFVYDTDNNGIDELIVYDDSWRFDMKIIQFKENYFTIEKQVGFNGFQKDLNPKFYEHLNLFGIKTNDNNFSIMLCGYNLISDEQHPYFNKTEDFPETIQLYAF